MPGFSRVAIHLALIALLLRGFLPAGWMPASHGDAPLVMCSVIADSFRDGHDADGKAVPGKDDPRAYENCTFAGNPGIAAPGNMNFFTPMLQDGDLDDYGPASVHFQSHGHAPQAPRAPPPSV